MLYGLAVVLVGVVQWSLFRHETNDGLARPTTRHRLGADQHKQPTQPSTRFLIFRPPFEAAQGVGNIMQGLLAAHALGFEDTILESARMCICYVCVFARVC